MEIQPSDCCHLVSRRPHTCTCSRTPLTRWRHASGPRSWPTLHSCMSPKRLQPRHPPRLCGKQRRQPAARSCLTPWCLWTHRYATALCQALAQFVCGPCTHALTQAGLDSAVCNVLASECVLLCALVMQDLQTALGKLGLELHQRYPFAVPNSFVWGFGRPLWNPSVRVLGLKPLRVMVLGPAASGKSMQCSLLADRCAQCWGPRVLLGYSMMLLFSVFGWLHDSTDGCNTRQPTRHSCLQRVLQLSGPWPAASALLLQVCRSTHQCGRPAVCRGGCQDPLGPGGAAPHGQQQNRARQATDGAAVAAPGAAGLQDARLGAGRLPAHTQAGGATNGQHRADAKRLPVATALRPTCCHHVPQALGADRLQAVLADVLWLLAPLARRLKSWRLLATCRTRSSCWRGPMRCCSTG